MYPLDPPLQLYSVKVGGSHKMLEHSYKQAHLLLEAHIHTIILTMVALLSTLDMSSSTFRN